MSCSMTCIKTGTITCMMTYIMTCLMNSIMSCIMSCNDLHSEKKKAIEKIQNQISHSNRVIQLVKQTERDTLSLDKDEAWSKEQRIL